MNTGILKRGCLIQFRCWFDGKVRCQWDAIYHGSLVAHAVGRRRTGGTWRMSCLMPEDRITKIKHGVMIERNLDTASV